MSWLGHDQCLLPQTNQAPMTLTMTAPYIGPQWFIPDAVTGIEIGKESHMVVYTVYINARNVDAQLSATQAPFTRAEPGCKSSPQGDTQDDRIADIQGKRGKQSDSSQCDEGRAPDIQEREECTDAGH